MLRPIYPDRHIDGSQVLASLPDDVLAVHPLPGRLADVRASRLAVADAAWMLAASKSIRQAGDLETCDTNEY